MSRGSWWARPRICHRLGELPAAERGLAAAWRELTDAGRHQEVALVSLDLAAVLLLRQQTRAAVLLLGLVGEGMETAKTGPGMTEHSLYL